MSSDAVEEGDAEAVENEARDDDSPAETRADLAAQVELLAEENRRLRRQYVASRRTADRKTALGLLAVGLLAALGGLALPNSRTVLFALGGTGVVGAVLTYYLTPERFVAADTGERTYAATAATGTQLVAELGLRDDRVYVPAPAPAESFADVRLFVPQAAEYAVPDPDDLDSLFVVSESGRDRGIAVPPTGGALYREFEQAMAEETHDHPAAVAAQLADALVEGFELLDAAETDADPEGGRVTMEVAGSAYGPVDRFDHPVVSLFGVGLADHLDAAVTVDVGTVEDGAADFFVTCEWDASEVDVDGE